MSSATATTPPATGRLTTAEVVSPRDDLITVILGACMMGGAMSDGWAHNNRIAEIQSEGFFTPWHALLYSGFAATAAWTVWLAFRRRDRIPRWWVDGWPVGYRIGALGVLIFLVGGLCDMVWHTIFGVEKTLDALMSPSHLLLLVGSALFLSSPTRSWWAAEDSRLRAATGVAAIGLATMAASIFLSFASAFQGIAPVLPYEEVIESFGGVRAAHGVASYVITTGLLAVPMLMVFRRRPAPGIATALTLLVAMFQVVTREFPHPQTLAAVAAIAAAVLVDVILVQLDRRRGFDAPLRLPIAAAVLAGLVAAAHLLALHFQDGFKVPVEIWSGTILVSALVAAVLGGLAARPVAP
jgi:hypothetical protein